MAASRTSVAPDKSSGTIQSKSPAAGRLPAMLFQLLPPSPD
jgi:hypothetical protein